MKKASEGNFWRNMTRKKMCTTIARGITVQKATIYSALSKQSFGFSFNFADKWI